MHILVYLDNHLVINKCAKASLSGIDNIKILLYEIVLIIIRDIIPIKMRIQVVLNLIFLILELYSSFYVNNKEPLKINFARDF